MKQKIIITGSVTLAQRARDILVNNGIKAIVKRLQNVAGAGCGYGVAVYETELEQATNLLENKDVKIRGIEEMIE